MAGKKGRQAKGLEDLPVIAPKDHREDFHVRSVGPFRPGFALELEMGFASPHSEAEMSASTTNRLIFRVVVFGNSSSRKVKRLTRL